jgi:hypothetical protein
MMAVGGQRHAPAAFLKSITAINVCQVKLGEKLKMIKRRVVFKKILHHLQGMR